MLLSKVLAAFFLAAAVAGCGSVNLNPIVTGTACNTRQQCVKDLRLPSPVSPEYVFVVDPYKMDGRAKGSFETSVLGPVNHGDVDLCVARALAGEFGDKAKIVFSKQGLEGPYAEIKILRADFRSAYTAGWEMKIEYRFTASGKSSDNTARSGIGNFLGGRKAAETQYPLACRILAKQVREKLGSSLSGARFPSP